MKLYIGGTFQDQEELARRENPNSVILTDFHETVREALRRGEDGAAVAGRLLRELPDAVVVANEIGAGIVPMDAEDRAWRENAGRALCILAEASQQVTRVVCGIGMRIK